MQEILNEYTQRKFFVWKDLHANQTNFLCSDGVFIGENIKIQFYNTSNSYLVN